MATAGGHEMCMQIVTVCIGTDVTTTNLELHAQCQQHDKGTSRRAPKGKHGQCGPALLLHQGLHSPCDLSINDDGSSHG